MASIVLIGIIVAIILYKSYRYVFTKPNNFPPGPPRIPFFGSYLFVLLMNYKHLHRGVDRLCVYYKTNILGFYFGSTPLIVANDGNSVKELLNKTEFDGRPKLMLATLRDPHEKLRGIFFTDGPKWKEQRRFALRHLRDYGFGRRFEELEYEIRDEITMFIDVLKNGPTYPHEMELMKNGNVYCPLIFSSTFGNAFLKILINERLSRKEQHIFTHAAEGTLRFQRAGDDYGRLFSLLQWTKDVFPNLTGFSECKEGSDDLYSFAKKIVDEQYQTFNEQNERNYLDLYFKEMRKAEVENVDTTFTYDQLVMSIWDLSLPVLTAISVTVTFLIQRILKQPEVLEKMQNEIDDIVGHGRLPNLDDRINLPYTEASIREIMRLETLVPSGLAHKALKQGTLGEFDVPKGTILFASLHALHEDPTKWKDPLEFKPERFIDQFGNLSLKKDISLPFGAGKRLCAGETFARNMLFLMVSSLAQNFHIKAPANYRIPDANDTMTGVIITTPNFWVRLEPR